MVVEAQSESEAIRAAMDGDGDYGEGSTEYAYTLEDESKYDVLEH